MSDDKAKALTDALAQITKDFGKGSISYLGDSTKSNVEAISTGIYALDEAIGIGGIPKGRVIEIFGPESSGKSTLCLSICAQAQKLGEVVAYIDAEHAMDPEYATLLGVDVNKMLISQPDSGEQGLSIAEKLIQSNAVGLIIVDSVAALVPQAEIEGEMGDSHMGLQARLMSQALRKLTSILSKSNTSIVFINQLRQKIGVMWGNPETTPGGMALKFYASVRLDIRRVESVKVGDTAIGNHVRVKVVKNKVAAPFKQAEFDIIFGKGISVLNGLFDACIDKGIIVKEGNTYSYGVDKIGVGRDKALKAIEELGITVKLEQELSKVKDNTAKIVKQAEIHKEALARHKEVF